MELFKHQQEALEQTKDLNRVAYYLDMGLGKTFVGAEKMKVMNSPVNLIVCQKSKIQDWIDHFNEHYATDKRSAFQKDLIFDLVKTYPDLKERIFGAMQRYPLPEWEPHGRYKRPKEQE